MCGSRVSPVVERIRRVVPVRREGRATGEHPVESVRRRRGAMTPARVAGEAREQVRAVVTDRQGHGATALSIELTRGELTGRDVLFEERAEVVGAVEAPDRRRNRDVVPAAGQGPRCRSPAPPPGSPIRSTSTSAPGRSTSRPRDTAPLPNVIRYSLPSASVPRRRPVSADHRPRPRYSRRSGADRRRAPDRPGGDLRR